eukprot:363584-Chlamydomonas_euryale.AAC.2
MLKARQSRGQQVLPIRGSTTCQNWTLQQKQRTDNHGSGTDSEHACESAQKQQSAHAPVSSYSNPVQCAAYYRGAMGILLVYDITDEASFNNIRSWMKNIEEHASDGVNKVRPGCRRLWLLGSKAALEEDATAGEALPEPCCWYLPAASTWTTARPGVAWRDQSRCNRGPLSSCVAPC